MPESENKESRYYQPWGAQISTDISFSGGDQ